MPDSILHRTKTDTQRQQQRLMGPEIIPQRYKTLHKNIIVLFG